MTRLERKRINKILAEVKPQKERSLWDTDDCMYLALSWAQGHIPMKSIEDIVGRKGGNCLAPLAVGLRRAIRQGKLLVTKL